MTFCGKVAASPNALDLASASSHPGIAQRRSSPRHEQQHTHTHVRAFHAYLPICTPTCRQTYDYSYIICRKRNSPLHAFMQQQFQVLARNAWAHWTWRCCESALRSHTFSRALESGETSLTSACRVSHWPRRPPKQPHALPAATHPRGTLLTNCSERDALSDFR